MPERKIMSHIRRWSRAVHRDLSFFFRGDRADLRDIGIYAQP